MTIPKPNNLYYAGAGMKLDGNKVDKWYDIAREYGEIPAAGADQTFAGSGRPEKMRAWDNDSSKVGAHQVSVEQQRTNVNRESLDLGDEFGLTKTIRHGTSPFGDENETCLIEFIADESNLSANVRLPVSGWSVNEGEYWTFSFWAKRVSGDSSPIGIRIDTSDTVQVFSVNVSTPQDVWEFFEFAFQIPEGDNSEFADGSRIRNAFSPPDVAYEFWEVQLESGRFATNRIRTEGSTVTRLRPRPEVISGLSKTGHIAATFDLLYNDRASQSGGAIEVLSKNSVGSDSGAFIPFSFIHVAHRIRFWDNYLGIIATIQPGHDDSNFGERFRVAAVASWDESEAWLYIYYESPTIQGKMHIGSDTIDNYDEALVPDSLYALKRGVSCRYETLMTSSEEIINDSDRAKQIISLITKYEGGLNLTPDQIPIQ